jgi:hypothetical protein
VHNSSNNKINFTKVDDLVFELNQYIEVLPDTHDEKQRIRFKAYARDLLFRIYNHVRGLEVLEFCRDDGSSNDKGEC